MFPALVDAAHTIGAVQTRNLGTLGGNLVTAVPSMDSGPTLVALDARVTSRAAGRRQMPLTEFFVGLARRFSSPMNCWSRSSSRKRTSVSRYFLKFGYARDRRSHWSMWRQLLGDGTKNVFVAPRIALARLRRR